MKSFVLKTSFYIVFIVLFAYFILAVSIYLYPDRFTGNFTEFHLWNFQKEKATTIKHQKLNVVLGDSRGMADLNPNYISNKITNFSISGGTPFEGFIMLKRLLNSGRKIDTLILCYGHFHYENSDVFNARTLPFGFIDNRELEGLQNIEESTGFCIDSVGPCSIGITVKINRNLILKRNPFAFRSEFIHNLTNNCSKVSATELYNMLESNRGHFLFGTDDSTSQVSVEVKRRNFEINKVIEHYLDSIFIVSKKLGISVLIATPPISILTYSKSYKDYFREFDSFLKKISKKYNISTINYTVVFENHYFGDPSHLNASGCKVYSNLINTVLGYRSP